MKKKRNNKGFSLVELIVVMAIMAILAVALAPRLVQYVDKAKQAQDHETINSIYTAVKYGLMVDSLVPSSTVTFELNDYTIATGTRTVNESSSVYEVANGTKTFVANADFTHTYKALVDEITATVPKFKLQSKLATERTTITITINSDSNYNIVLDYDGDVTPAGVVAVTTNDRYTLDSTSIY
jgi:type IV pilus assembly protein PilA